ncbi:hypothetical protein [Azospirillum canadense]|uniref:hypothetical protein n=1 Tax=Azospirillum canadense TaxID=403962 RepID=UPI0022266C8F|nr:hypothetical protein [Azospirillum canadense]MCW2240759.1 hypothetical protein [Azospirillum canadense]
MPRATFVAGRLDVETTEDRVTIVWRRGGGLADVALLAYEAHRHGVAQEAMVTLAELLVDTVLRAESGSGRSSWKVAAVVSWMAIAGLGGVLSGAAAMGGEESWSRLGTMAAAKVWPSTCSTPGQGAGMGVAPAPGSAGVVLGGAAGWGGPGPLPPRPAAAAAADGAGRGGGGSGLAAPDGMRRRVQEAERALQAQVERLSREQAEQGERAANAGDGSGGFAAGPTVKTGVFVPLAE